MAENFVKCRCLNCDGSIEFESSNAGATVTCPHCNMETVLFLTFPRGPAVKSKKDPKVAVKWLVFIGVFAPILSAMLLSPYDGTWQGLLWVSLYGAALYCWGKIVYIYRAHIGAILVCAGLGMAAINALFPNGDIKMLIFGGILAVVGGILWLVKIMKPR